MNIEPRIFGRFKCRGELSVRHVVLMNLVQLLRLYRQVSPGIRRRLVALAVYVKCARHSAIFDAGGQLLQWAGLEPGETL